MGTNFAPTQSEYKGLGQFKYWCQKVLPMVYEDSISYYELLGKVVNYLNETISNMELVGEDMTKVYTAYNQLQDWVNNYFANLDAQQMINKKLDTMASDGSLSELIQPLFDMYKDGIGSVVRVQNEQINVLQARMNAFTTLTNASTTGDAELQDARVGWNGVAFANVGESIRNQLKSALKFVGRVNTSNYATVLPDLDVADNNSVYELVFVDGSVDIPANCPFTEYQGSLNTILTFGLDEGLQKSQLFICNMNGRMWVRQTVTGNRFNSWVDVTPNLSDYFTTTGRVIASNYATTLPDLNNAKSNTIYELLFAEGSEEIPSNCPFTKWSASICILITFGMSITQQKSQLFISMDTGEMWVRQTGTGYVWKVWVKCGTKELQSVRITPTDNLLEVLLNNKGKEIFVERGTYNIIEHYKAYLGEDYFDTYEGYASGGNNLGRGLPVFRGTKLRFAPGAKLLCHYNGSNSLVTGSFSAIALESDVTLDGMTLECSGIRDAIHDDFDNGYDGTTVIENCHIVSAIRCIAGGFGVSSKYILQNNHFEVTGSFTDDVTYHNNSASNALNRLVVKDNYFSKRLSIRYYGASVDVSKVLVCGNSFANDVEVRSETADSTVVNVEVIKWGNTIR